jgi:hypothetical protein
MGRLVNRVRSRAVEMTGVQVAIFCLGVAAAFVIIMFLSTMDFPHLF